MNFIKYFYLIFVFFYFSVVRSQTYCSFKHLNDSIISHMKDGEISYFKSRASIMELKVKIDSNAYFLYKFHPNGKLKSFGKILNSKKEGTWSFFSRSGKFKYYILYKNSNRMHKFKRFINEVG